MIQYKCRVCGGLFERALSSGPKPVVCSDLCRKEFMKEYYKQYRKKNKDRIAKYKKRIYKKQCEKCLLCFEAKFPKQKYCSPVCASKRNELPRQYCVICKKPFAPNSITTLCCSPECGKIRGGLTLSLRDYKYPPGLTDRERSNFRQNINRNERMKTDPKYKLNHRMRCAVKQCLNGNKDGSWKELVGYSVDELKRHLEKLFQPDMTWENLGKWHIDHKIPISAFNFTKPEHLDFKRCWALKNLQPMWAEENLSKGASLEKHFQPGLRI